MEENKVLVEMKDIYKKYPGVQALAGVNFSLRAGEVHSLCGENGAGKSTLIKILTGVEHCDSGTIYLNGEQISPKTSAEAQALGISTVYQEVNLCPNLSVAENIYIGRQPKNKFKVVDWKRMNKLAENAMAKLNIKLDVSARLDEYSVAIQQMVAIAKALDVNAKVLVLDEPTSSLDKLEVENLFKIIQQLKAKGIGIIFITHFFEQIFKISDTVTILRNGNFIGKYEIGNLNRLMLVEKMIGKELADFDTVKNNLCTNENKEVYYKAEEIGKRGTIFPFNISINKGEVTGLAGLLGSGRTETARLVFGVDKHDSGKTYVNGKPRRIRDPREAVKHGMAFCPEDRKVEGLLPDMTVRENIIIALQGRTGMFKKLSRSKQNELVNKYIKALNIATPSADQLVRNLSGGNQQKVLLARWLVMNPSFLIVDEPTRGIDVGAKAEIQKLIMELAGQGKSVLFISSELDEVIRCSQKVYVYKDKNVIDELVGNDISGVNILRKIANEN
jgi:monosaccharide-transporting ATPase